MVRLPLIAILFPYTTLFRSAEFGRQDDVSRSKPTQLEASGSLITRRFRSRQSSGSASQFDLPEPNPTHQPRSLEDRKSTRLNSSHVSISYAVFCLKKKKRSQ